MYVLHIYTYVIHVYTCQFTCIYVYTYSHIHIHAYAHYPIILTQSSNVFLPSTLPPLPPDSKQNGDAAANAAALANEDCPTIDQVLGDERSPATGGLGSTASRERYPHDRACFLLSAGEFQRTTDGNVRKGRREGVGRLEGGGGAGTREAGRGLSSSTRPSRDAWY